MVLRVVYYYEHPASTSVRGIGKVVDDCTTGCKAVLPDCLAGCLVYLFALVLVLSNRAVRTNVSKRTSLHTSAACVEYYTCSFYGVHTQHVCTPTCSREGVVDQSPGRINPLQVSFFST
ncbi:hypothetical protein KQX54_020895 [Cotesia glomerata]|uniref:Uncharacterized protein n=1 Tax=Cotesia glomerata TaxID=32391 RepID=A0AAV7I527_COTGL|nr:hypothetical protein KQX54_020895 [Cotesia glomerata]